MTPRAVLVSGGAGFIGRALVARLRANGSQAIELNRLDDAAVWSQVRGRCDAMVHLANVAHKRAAPRELRQTNVEGTRRAAERALAAGVRHFVYLSSIKVHGEDSPPGGFDEDAPLNPADAYGESKAQAEQTLRALSGEVQIAILRPPLVYGPHVKANFRALLATIARGVPLPLASICNRRSMIFVDNLVDAIVRCLDARGTFLVADREAISTQQLCREIGEALGRRAWLFPFPVALLPNKLAASLEVNDSLIRRTLGWRQPFTREEGLKATADWYLGR